MTEIEHIKNKIEKSFNQIIFEKENHTYHLKKKQLFSVSSRISNYKSKFDTHRIATAYAKKKRLKVDDVIKEWSDINKQSIDLGHRVHDFGEIYFIDKTIEPELPQEKAIIAYWNSIPEHEIPVMCETIVYSEQLGYAGTFDLLFYDTIKKGLIIKDWKSNKDIYKNFNNKKMNKPFDFLLDMPLSAYELQLSYYQIPLEDIGLNVIGREVIWLKDDETFEVIQTTDYSQHIRYYESLRN